MSLTLSNLCIAVVKSQLNLENSKIPEHWNQVGIFQLLLPENIDSILTINKTEEKLHISNLPLFDGCHTIEIDINQTFKGIDEVSVSNYQLVNKTIYQTFLSVEKLSLTHQLLKSYGVARIGYQYKESLTNLNINGCTGISADSLSCLNACSLLKVLNLENCAVVLSVWMLPQEFQAVYIGGNTVSFVAIVELVRNSRNSLEVFSLWGMESMKSIAAQLALKELSVIKVLDLRWIPFPEVLGEVLPVLSTLESLDLSFTNATEEFVDAVSNLSLLSLDLAAACISATAVPKLSSLVTLKSLTISGISFSSNATHLDPPVFGFSQLVYLESLDLSDSYILAEFCEDQLFPHSLKHLNLSNVHFLAARLQQAIAPSIGLLEALKTLLLANRRDNVPWTNLLDRALANKSKLTNLDATGCIVSSASVQQLALCRKLKILILSEAQVSDDDLLSLPKSSFPKLEKLELPIVFPLSSSDRIRNNLLNYKKAKGASSLATNATNSRITPTKLKRITNKKYLATALDVQKALKQLKTLELVNAALNSTNNSATSVDEVESSSIEISIQSEKIESFLDKMMAVRDLPISKYALPSMTELPVMSTAIAQRSALGCSLRL